MQRSLFKWWLFLLVISKIQGGLQELWESKNHAVNHRIMKIILDSCYEDDNVTNPTLIFGDFREFIDKSSIIWLNRSFNCDSEEEYILHHHTSYQPSKIIFIENSLEQFESDLYLLRMNRWWNHKASFFIVENNDNTCENFEEMLMVSWEVDNLDSIYICTESGRTALYTLNPFANYAPSPWKIIEEFHNYSLFYQYFDSEISCENLHYDKTRNIHGTELTMVGQAGGELIPGQYYFEDILLKLPNVLPIRLLHYVLESLNATAEVTITKDGEELTELIFKTAADMSVDTVLKFIDSNFLITYPEWSEMVAVIKLGPEISTLTKIRQLWAVPVLITAAVAFGILFIVLTILSHDLSSALLDLTRLLTYTSVLINSRSHKFRIYFATMLIFMVISNGVFQGSIAAFLTKRERQSPVETIDDLIKLKYVFYSPFGQEGMTEYVCPNCDVKETSTDQCIELVLNSSRHACLIYKDIYDQHFNLKFLDYVKVSITPRNEFFISRLEYPLKDRIEKTIMKIFESGIMEMWKNHLTHFQKNVRLAMEAEWSSSQYKPVKLYKLMFAFQVLALGLSISTIVFFLELLVAKYGKFWKIKGRIFIYSRGIRK